MNTPDKLELRDILAAGSTDPLYRKAQTMIGVFFTSLVRRYRDIQRSRLRASTHSSGGDPLTNKAVSLGIPQHALALRRVTMNQACVLGMSIVQSWATLNTTAVHKTALSQSHAFLGSSVRTGTQIVDCDSISHALQSWIAKFSENPMLEELAEQLVRDAGMYDSATVVRETCLLGRSEGIDAPHTSLSSNGTASVASIAQTDAFPSISETDRSELVQALGITEVAFSGDEVVSVATTAYAADQTRNNTGKC